MKQLNLPKEAINALMKNATMFIEPVPIYLLGNISQENQDSYTKSMLAVSAYNEGDEVYIVDDTVLLLSHPPQPKIVYKATIKNVKVIRAQDLPWNIKLTILVGFSLDNQEHNVFIDTLFKDWYNNEYGNYEDNPYVFLYEVEREIKIPTEPQP
jgi:sulfur relay (sulfurtransferase) DsrF/TusC family protein